jgi:hypothetical protein
MNDMVSIRKMRSGPGFFRTLRSATGGAVLPEEPEGEADADLFFGGKKSILSG